VARLGFSAGQTASGAVVGNLSHESLARMLGASRQSVNRQLKELERAGLIHVSYGKITIPDLASLIRNCEPLIGAESIVPDYGED